MRSVTQRSALTSIRCEDSARCIVWCRLYFNRLSCHPHSIRVGTVFPIRRFVLIYHGLNCHHQHLGPDLCNRPNPYGEQARLFFDSPWIGGELHMSCLPKLYSSISPSPDDLSRATGRSDDLCTQFAVLNLSLL
jgi:hypothetical protein